MKDLYEKFAYDYDEFGKIEEDLGDEKVFLKILFDRYHVKTVLDCACGTGKHLYLLSELGFAVSGSDYSGSMIEVAHRNLQRHNKQIPLCQCDFRYLESKFNTMFDAVVCLTTSLPHLHTDEDLLLALISMKQRIKKGGILVLTQGMTHYMLALPAIEVVVNREDFSRVFIKERGDAFQVIHVLDLFHSESRMENRQYEIKYRILLKHDYERLLFEAGFKAVNIYGEYDGRAYDQESRRLIVVAVNE